MKLVFKFIFLSFFVFSFTACLLNTSGIQHAFNLPSVGADFAPSDSESMYIDIDIDSYESNDTIPPYYEISTSEEYGDSALRESPSNCEIEYVELEENDAEREWTENMLCILDIPEYEFVTKDLHLIYNFPEGMCESTSVALPWHFNREIQAGPVSTECERPAEEEGEEGGTGYCDSRADSYASCDDDICLEEEGNLCGGEIKCCYGGAKIDGSRWIPDIECFGGPALTTKGSDFPREGFYRHIVTDLPEDGLRNTITLENMTELNGAPRVSTRPVSIDGDGTEIYSGYSGFTGANFPYANYLKILDKSPDQLQSVGRSSLPAFLQPSNHYDYEPRPFFEFSCLDSGGEVIHKILMMIREWNTFEEFIEFYNEGGSDDPDPDVEGEEGDECKYGERASLENQDEQCNDYLDLDDIINCDNNLYPGWCTQFSTSQYPYIRYKATEVNASQ